jgi:hypothetical protein
MSHRAHGRSLRDVHVREKPYGGIHMQVKTHIKAGLAMNYMRKSGE